MKDILDALIRRAEFLDKIISKVEMREASFPEGSLRIRKKNNKGVYYYREDKTDTNGKYIPRKNDLLARKLAQKDYEKKYKQFALAESKAIKNLLAEISSNKCIDCYSALNPLRKELIEPFEISDNEYREKWESISYDGLRFRENEMSNFITDAGERVRSKSELLIANTLYKCNIPYRYECPLTLGNYTIYPDFTVLNVRRRKVLYWEHFGMMGDTEYTNNAIKKINRYANEDIVLGDKLIATFESLNTPIATESIRKMIEAYLL